MKLLFAVATVTLASAVGCASTHPPLTTVDYVDVPRYMGRWYEIARYPVSFQEGCEAVTADYTLLTNGRVEVVNSCRQDSVDGELRQVRGTGRIVDPRTNAKLKVTFFWPFEGDYWIIDLDQEEYQWAVVSVPTRKMLWILSRTPQMEPAVYADILARLPDKNLDPAKLRLTAQPEQ